MLPGAVIPYRPNPPTDGAPALNDLTVRTAGAAAEVGNESGPKDPLSSWARS